ncbi:hypothetical protein EXIGLDRAFT_776354 [Exidia glandulosa HHB12029]|uniref:Uncharacterized protein n=1 Tax=Exidia glandulosa HHB12029 TaxID=1314781 RepID=A0A165DIK4_EXIGL|nr:hypothetical protein EXIGLDRAFT_776354 [Exidia glandulosa HHB12029]
MTDSGPTPDYLEQYRVPCVPDVYYIPDFINHRARGGIPASSTKHPSRGIIKDGVLAGQSPRAPDPVTRLRESAKHGQPNHVIVNQYLAGQAVRSWPGVGSHTVFNYYKHADGPSKAGRAVDRTPRSLVITRSSLYTGHLHGIEERTQDVLGGDDGVKVTNAAEEARTGGTLTRETRMSSTCRDVERVLDVKRSGK